MVANCHKWSQNIADVVNVDVAKVANKIYNVRILLLLFVTVVSSYTLPLVLYINYIFII